MTLLFALARSSSDRWNPTWPLVICLIGLAVWFLGDRWAKLAEAGKLMFFCGLLVVLFGLAGVAVF